MKYNRIIHQLHIAEIKLQQALDSLEAEGTDVSQALQDINQELSEVHETVISCSNRLQEMLENARQR